LCGMLVTPQLGMAKTLNNILEINLTKGGFWTFDFFWTNAWRWSNSNVDIDWITTFYSFYCWIAWALPKIYQKLCIDLHNKTKAIRIFSCTWKNIIGKILPSLFCTWYCPSSCLSPLCSN
jgi:hypothetical protein